MGILSRWFGQVGVVSFKGLGESGREFTGKCNLEFFNKNKEQAEEYLKKVFFAETGERAVKLWIITFVQFN